jgi:internalin A
VMLQYTHGLPLALVSIAAPEDAPMLSRWERHLRPLEQAGLLSFWSELHLAPGGDRVQAFQHQLNAADLVLLLLSADFFTAPNCLDMMEQALERSRTGAVQVIHLLLRPVAWQESPLAQFEPWPSHGEPSVPSV